MLTAIQSVQARGRLPIPAWVFAAQAVLFPALAALVSYGFDRPAPKFELCVMAGLAGFNVAMALMTRTCNRILRGR